MAKASPSQHQPEAPFSNEPININEEASLNYWVRALDCSELELRLAVAEVGPYSLDVGTELGRVS